MRMVTYGAYAWRRIARSHGPVLRQLVLLAVVAVPATGCSDGRDSSREAGRDGSDEPASDLITTLDDQTPELQFVLREWHGDLDGIIAERFGLIRLLTVLLHTMNGECRGIPRRPDLHRSGR